MKKDWVVAALLAIWLGVTIVGVAAMSVRHMAPLPVETKGSLLTSEMLKLRRGASGNPAAGFAVHVIYGECSCSRSLLAHLVDRKPFKNTGELILFVGQSNADSKTARQQAIGAGYNFAYISAEELTSRFELEAAPVYLEFDPAGVLRYAGGYFETAAALVSMDAKIHEQVMRGLTVAPFPIFGCAVSARLQKSLQPLDLILKKR